MKINFVGIFVFFVWCLPLFCFGQDQDQDQETRAIIQLRFSEEDSKKYVIAQANEIMNDSVVGPIEEIDLYFYVERTFSLLPIGDRFNTTDEKGEVTVEFPLDLPGDSLGNVNVYVRIEEADDYPDTEVKATINWGIPTQIDDGTEKRSLWAAGANAPISLLILTNIMIAAAWGIVFYIVYKLYLISKM